MQRGRIAEMGPAREAPEHPYSRLLKASVLSTEQASDVNLTVTNDFDSAAAISPEGRLVARPGGAWSASAATRRISDDRPASAAGEFE